MRIETLYFATLRNLTGLAREEVNLDEGAKLRHLLEYLFDVHGERFRNALDLGNSHAILVNGLHHETLQGMETTLKHGDRVVFLPITMGG
ncbi:MAG: MoaD/ThiS family protein [Deltaproteobacteria bacterium]|nr:MoaD/ThiS family protein [Deltaproteobacteria bacterium]